MWDGWSIISVRYSDAREGLDGDTSTKLRISGYIKGEYCVGTKRYHPKRNVSSKLVPGLITGAFSKKLAGIHHPICFTSSCSCWHRWTFFQLLLWQRGCQWVVVECVVFRFGFFRKRIYRSEKIHVKQKEKRRGRTWGQRCLDTRACVVGVKYEWDQEVRYMYLSMRFISCSPSPFRKRSRLELSIRQEQRESNRFSIISCSSAVLGLCRLNTCMPKGTKKCKPLLGCIWTLTSNAN